MLDIYCSIYASRCITRAGTVKSSSGVYRSSAQSMGKDGDREWTCEIALPLEDIVTRKIIRLKPGIDGG